MPSRDELVPITATAILAGATIGTAVPAGQRRYVYRVEVENQFAGANVVTLSRNGVDIAVWGVGIAVGDMYIDPDELKENSLPLYIAEATEQFTVTSGAGDAFVRMTYVDAV